VVTTLSIQRNAPRSGSGCRSSIKWPSCLVAPLPLMCGSPSSASEPRAEDNHVYVYECILKVVYPDRST
jgi:hypothetical protein